MKTIIVQYRAFGSDIAFEFTANPNALLGVPVERVLEWIFRECNHVDDSEWISQDPVARKLGLRSMSVGDEVILVNDDSTVARYRVAGVGFEEIRNVR